MQKVSKQSLAMLALSILLAISIALTFTFAALSDQRKATGSITFSGNVAITYDSSATDGTITLTADYVDSEFDITDKEFGITGSDAYVTIQVKVTDASVTVTLPSSLSLGSQTLENATTTITAGQTATFTCSEKLTVGSGLNIALTDIITKISFDAEAGTLNNGSIEVTVAADTRSVPTIE